MTKIKEIGCKRFEVALYQDLMYYVIMLKVDGKEYRSEKIVGLLTANYLFDAKLQELEGN